MAPFEPYNMIARKLAKGQFGKEELLKAATFMVDDIERLLGPRLSDHAYEFEGIYFASSHGQMEYRIKNGRHVTKIRLSGGSRREPGGALWELAHECVHLITPFGSSTVLEEGVACWYQERWVDKIPQIFPEWTKTRRAAGYFPSYDEAYVLVKEMMERDPCVIKRLREKQPVISKITARQIKKEAGWLGDAFSKKLAAKFRRGRQLRRPKPPEVIRLLRDLRLPNDLDASSAVGTKGTIFDTMPPPNDMRFDAFNDVSSVRLRADLVEGQNLSSHQLTLETFDARESEIARQAARLHLGLELKCDRIAQLDITTEDVLAAFQQIYGHAFIA